jgi:hypothetical protein
LEVVHFKEAAVAEAEQILAIAEVAALLNETTADVVVTFDELDL